LIAITDFRFGPGCSRTHMGQRGSAPAYSDDGNGHWVIQAPKLRFFHIADILYHGWMISDLPSLEEARIECPFNHDFVKHMAGLARARSLHLEIEVKLFS